MVGVSSFTINTCHAIIYNVVADFIVSTELIELQNACLASSTLKDLSIFLSYNYTVTFFEVSGWKVYQKPERPGPYWYVYYY